MTRIVLVFVASILLFGCGPSKKQLFEEASKANSKRLIDGFYDQIWSTPLNELDRHIVFEPAREETGKPTIYRNTIRRKGFIPLRGEYQLTGIQLLQSDYRKIQYLEECGSQIEIGLGIAYEENFNGERTYSIQLTNNALKPITQSSHIKKQFSIRDDYQMPFSIRKQSAGDKYPCELESLIYQNHTSSNYMALSGPWRMPIEGGTVLKAMLVNKGMDLNKCTSIPNFDYSNEPITTDSYRHVCSFDGEYVPPNPPFYPSQPMSFSVSRYRQSPMISLFELKIPKTERHLSFKEIYQNRLQNPEYAKYINALHDIGIVSDVNKVMSLYKDNNDIIRSWNAYQNRLSKQRSATLAEAFSDGIQSWKQAVSEVSYQPVHTSNTQSSSSPNSVSANRATLRQAKPQVSAVKPSTSGSASAKGQCTGVTDASCSSKLVLFCEAELFGQADKTVRRYGCATATLSSSGGEWQRIKAPKLGDVCDQKLGVSNAVAQGVGSELSLFHTLGGPRLNADHWGQCIARCKKADTTGNRNAPIRTECIH